MLNLFINPRLYNIKSSHLSASWKYFVLPLNSLSTLYLFKNHFSKLYPPNFSNLKPESRPLPFLPQPSPHPINHQVPSMLPPKFHPLLPVPTTSTLVQAAIISGRVHHTGLQPTSLASKPFSLLQPEYSFKRQI